MTKFVHGAAPAELSARPARALTGHEIALRLADVAEIPGSARDALGPLQRAGWAVTPTYCRGWTLDTDAAGRAATPRLVDSLALRCQRLRWHVPDGEPYLVRAVGLWLGGSWNAGYVGVPWKRYGYRDWLKAMKEWTT